MTSNDFNLIGEFKEVTKWGEPQNIEIYECNVCASLIRVYIRQQEDYSQLTKHAEFHNTLDRLILG